MKKILTVLTLLLMALPSTAQNISYYMRGLIQKENAAQARAYLGVTNGTGGTGGIAVAISGPYLIGATNPSGTLVTISGINQVSGYTLLTTLNSVSNSLLGYLEATNAILVQRITDATNGLSGGGMLQTNIPLASVTNAGSLHFLSTNNAAPLTNLDFATGLSMTGRTAVTNAAQTVVSNYPFTLTEKTYVQTNDFFQVSGTNKVLAENLFASSNQTFKVGAFTSLSSGPGYTTSPALLTFWPNHGDGNGLIQVGASSGSVDINPAGTLQIGESAIARAYVYLQYITTPTASFPLGFSQPLEFRARSTNAAVASSIAYKYPGIAGFAANTDAASELGELRFYARAPHWTFGQVDPDSPTTPGTEILRVGTNGVIAAQGYQFKGDGGGLTNIGGAGGLSVTINGVDIFGNYLQTVYTSGVLTATNTWDTDALTYFTRASITNMTFKVAVSDFFRTLKAANIYTNFGAVYFLPTEAGWTNNAVNTSNNIVVTGTVYPTNGVGFASANSASLNTAYNPSTDSSWSQNSATMAVYVGTASPTGDPLGTATTPTKYASFRVSSPYARLQGINHAINLDVNAGADWKGLWVATRTASLEQHSYLRWTANADTSNASVGNPTSAFTIGARNANGTPDTFFTGNIRFVALGRGLDGTGTTNFINAVATLKTALSWP